MNSAVGLVRFQSLAALVWTVGACLPLFLTVFPAVFSLLLCLLFVLLGLLRLVVHGQVRKVEFAPLPSLVRVVVFASPTHAAHGLALGVMFQEDFFPAFILAWVFSTLHLVRAHNQLKFDHSTTRLQQIVLRFPDFCLVSVFGLNLVLAVLMVWTPVLSIVSIGLCVSELVFTVICSETRRVPVDFPQFQLAKESLEYCEKGTVLECFQGMPMLVNKTSPQPALFQGLFSNTFWQDKQHELEFSVNVTRFEGSDLLVKLGQVRFDLAAQAVYYREAQLEGSVFAERAYNLLPWMGVLEASRLRAFQYTSSAAGMSPELLDCALQSGLDVLDAQALKLASFARVLSKQKPRNLETGLDESEAYGPVDSPKDCAWVLHNTKYTGRMWMRRVWRADWMWEFDPIYEENVRRLGNNSGRGQTPWWMQRNATAALLDEFELCVQVSKTLPQLAKQKQRRDVTELVRATMQRLTAACNEAERIGGPKTAGDENLFYAMSFCLERDMQQLA
ncbi:hypothetical protein BASA81_010540 [Batrachochytrium salamandrivorans]|nr:hypothetical protein BASA81_010540 [Batrachochytrium salamandrivorans]